MDIENPFAYDSNDNWASDSVNESAIPVPISSRKQSAVTFVSSFQQTPPHPTRMAPQQVKDLVNNPWASSPPSSPPLQSYPAHTDSSIDVVSNEFGRNTLTRTYSASPLTEYGMNTALEDNSKNVNDFHYPQSEPPRISFIGQKEVEGSQGFDMDNHNGFEIENHFLPTPNASTPDQNQSLSPSRNSSDVRDDLASSVHVVNGFQQSLPVSDAFELDLQETFQYPRTTEGFQHESVYIDQSDVFNDAPTELQHVFDSSDAHPVSDHESMIPFEVTEKRAELFETIKKAQKELLG